MPRRTYARVLRRAVAILGGTNELQLYLSVSKVHLEAWLHGVSDPPAEVFLRVVDLVLDPDVAAAFASTQRLADSRLSPVAHSQGGALQFHIGGGVVARCPTCDCIDFRMLDPAARPRHTSRLECQFCKQELSYGDLAVLAGKEAVECSNAAIVNLWKRQQGMLKRPSVRPAAARASGSARSRER